jgi:hypothetical protein
MILLVLIYQFYIAVQYTILTIYNYNLIKIECVLCFFYMFVFAIH